MLLRFFSGNQPISLLLLPLLAVLLWLPGFFAEPFDLAGPEPMPLYELLTVWLADLHWLQLLLALLLVVVQAFFVNSLANDLHLLEKRSNLPGLCFLLLNALFPEQLQLSPVLLANTFLLLAMYRLYAIAGSERAGALAFDAAFLIGIASLLHPPTLVLLPVVYFALNDFRPFNGREWLLPLMGIALPWLFAWSWFFWFDTTPEFANALSHGFAWNGVSWLGSGTAFYALAGMSLVMLMMSLAQAIRTIGQNVVEVRKMLTELVWLALLVVVSVLLAPVKSVHLLTLASFPVSIWLSQAFQQSKRTGLMEVFLLLWLGLIFYHRFA